MYPQKNSILKNSYDNLEKQILDYCSKKKRVCKEIKALITLLSEFKDRDQGKHEYIFVLFFCTMVIIIYLH